MTNPPFTDAVHTMKAFDAVSGASFFTMRIILPLFFPKMHVLPGAILLATLWYLPVVTPIPAPAPLAVTVVEAATIPAPVANVAPEHHVPSPHAHLLIPRIGVDAAIDDMGLTADGAMAVPDSTVTVGWFSLGTRPGDVGSAVIGGHNVWDGTAGAFTRLEELTIGDVMTVVDIHGVSTTFIVRATRTIDTDADATEIFTSYDNGAHLNVITCDGTWDNYTQQYAKRLVVFTDLLSE